MFWWILILVIIGLVSSVVVIISLVVAFFNWISDLNNAASSTKDIKVSLEHHCKQIKQLSQTNKKIEKQLIELEADVKHLIKLSVV
jgi:septal ring factor EnvC (AmiA/AmiB activator)